MEEQRREKRIGGVLHWRTKDATWRPYSEQEMQQRNARIEHEMEMERVPCFKDDDK